MTTQLTLWQISQEQQEINALLEENGGEITDEILERLSANEQALEVKSKNYIFSLRQYKALAENVDAEIKRLQAIKKTCERSQESLKNMLDIAMTQFGLDRLDLGEVGKISYRKSDSVVVEDVNELDREFCKVKLEADKMKIKEAIKAGKEVKGAFIETKSNIQIR